MIRFATGLGFIALGMAIGTAGLLAAVLIGPNGYGLALLGCAGGVTLAEHGIGKW